MAQVEGAAALGAHAVELHTGAWCRAGKERQAEEIGRIKAAASCADRVGIECHAGHGLSYENVGPGRRRARNRRTQHRSLPDRRGDLSRLEESIARMRALMDGRTAAAAALI